nr:hypothetical protein C1892_09240 [Pseudomonas sp. MPBD7-1]
MAGNKFSPIIQCKYSAAWKLLDKAYLGQGDLPAARQAWEQGLEAARAHGDKQASIHANVIEGAPP